MNQADNSTPKKISVTQDLVAYSRAGDIFHYRWAARRCLQLLDFNSNLKQITIEGSKEPKLGGEYVIDTAEYSIEENNSESVEYFQLKHSTVRVDTDFTLSSLKGTIEGFADRYRDLDKRATKFSRIKFTLITNRPISQNLKRSITKVAEGKSGGKVFDDTIKTYTKLDGNKLAEFCKFLQLVDGEGDYDTQKQQLHRELARLTCEAQDTKPVLNLIELVRSRIEPKSVRKDITKDDVLAQFELTSEKDLFPAPPIFEKLSSTVVREQYNQLYQAVVDPDASFLIFKAVGGTGKSIACNQLIERFNNGSLAIAYDCYGNGGYRKLSEHRHRLCDAFVQVANQLAQLGLCEPMIPINRDQDDRLTQGFLTRLSQAVSKLRESNQEALLVILFDAVDNAEMAALEFSDRCFASHLLKETLPAGCRIVYLSRPERVHLFNPPDHVLQFEIEAFTDQESLLHLQTNYPNASLSDAIEFRRLTGGNPRVQANALALNKQSIEEVLSYLGAGGKTVDDLIEEQLRQAVSKVKASYPAKFEQHVEDICTGLASLPPFVPLEVLATVSGTEISAVKSFIADLGRPLWLTDDYVQFRDEPTETWFTKTYAATAEQLIYYINRLEPLAGKFSYVAEVLPSLLLRSGQYDQLIALALSEEKLPTDNPVDARSIQVYRLQFAFRAALKNKKYSDACKLALRAGEEMAGSRRQLELLSKNIDLATLFLSEQRLIELAHQRHIRSGWDGSGTLYSALLLSSFPEYEGEARSYLRSAQYWLRRYIQNRDKENDEDNPNSTDELNDSDVLAMFICHYQLDGANIAVNFIQRWSPDELIFRVMREFSRQMIDASEFDALDRITSCGKNCPVLVIAVNHELSKVGRTSNKECLETTLNKFVSDEKSLKVTNDIFNDYNVSSSAFLSFLESCLINKVEIEQIAFALNHYIDEPRIHSINDKWRGEHRSNFFRAIAIRACIENRFDFSVVDVLPKRWETESKNYRQNEELQEVSRVIEVMLPWYLVRANLLAGEHVSIDTLHQQAEEISARKLGGRYRENDPLPYEITNARFFNLVLAKSNVDSELKKLSEEIENQSLQFRLQDKLRALNIANRNSRLTAIADILEESCFQALQVADIESGPMENADDLIKLSRAVLASSEADAEAYFEKAIRIVSRFGDEAVERWEAVVSIAKYCVTGGNLDPKQAYRFMRCAELIGNTVAREKHWDRDDAMATCFYLSPNSAFAIASRWNDRKVGRSGRMLARLLETALSMNAITAAAAWSAAALPFDYDLVDFAGKCIAKETDKKNQQIIFNDLVSLYRQRGTNGESWRSIDKLAKKYLLQHDALEQLDLLMGGVLVEEEIFNSNPTLSQNTDNHSNCEDIYGDINFLSDEGLRQAIIRFYALEGSRDFVGLWEYAASKVSNANAIQYLSLVSNCDYLDLYDIKEALRSFPDRLKKKQGVIKTWPSIVKTIAERFPEKFVSRYDRDWVLQDIGADENTLNAVSEGVIKSLSESSGLESAGTLYGFAGFCVQKTTVEEAKVIFDFALSRFELHIEPEYADGPWSAELQPTEQLTSAFTGYVWTCLGSPESFERWRGAHVVRRFYRLGCQLEIDALIEWLCNGQVNAFIGKNNIFYILHAKLYLLVALARCAKDSVGLLTKHSKTFSDIALFGEAHILIQKYSADIALAIAQANPSIYEHDTIIRLQQVGKSQYPIYVTQDYCERRDTPWHQQNDIDTSLDLSFAYDFDRYWFESLGDVFKVPGMQVEDLATEVVLKDWRLSFEDRYIHEPRQELWKNRRDRSTWHSHASYPKTDNYKFYLSYHAMMVVAAKLQNKMPIIKSSDEDTDPFQDWLSGHLLTRDDGFWLSDRRDFFPAERRLRLDDKRDKNWRWQILSKDFLDVLLLEQKSELWLNIAGSWNEYINGHNESIYISSRLVPSWAAMSLQRVMQHDQSESMDDVTLSHFEGWVHPDLGNNPFSLKRWYTEGEHHDRIDEFDPYAGALDYPPITLNQEIALKLGLKGDTDNRYWNRATDNAPMLCSQLWSEDKPQQEDNDYCSKGNRLQASLKFLNELLQMSNMDLVIQVDISRQLTGVYRDRDDEFGYPSPYRKIYFLSRNGKLRDATTTFELREKVTTKP